MNSIASDLGISRGRDRVGCSSRHLAGLSGGWAGTVPVAGPTARVPAWRRLLSFAGPGYLVAAGYMGPGNWATLYCEESSVSTVLSKG